MGLFHFYDIGNTDVYVFDDFLIKQVKEGAFINDEETELFVEIIKKHFIIVRNNIFFIGMFY